MEQTSNVMHQIVQNSRAWSHLVSKMNSEIDTKNIPENSLGLGGMLSDFESRLQVKLLYLWPLKKCGFCLNDSNVFPIPEWIINACRNHF